MLQLAQKLNCFITNKAFSEANFLNKNTLFHNASIYRLPNLILRDRAHCTQVTHMFSFSDNPQLLLWVVVHGLVH